MKNIYSPPFTRRSAPKRSPSTWSSWTCSIHAHATMSSHFSLAIWIFVKLLKMKPVPVSAVPQNHILKQLLNVATSQCTKNTEQLSTSMMILTGKKCVVEEQELKALDKDQTPCQLVLYQVGGTFCILPPFSVPKILNS